METNDKINRMNDDELNKIHANSLGLTVPENYFSESKNRILDKVLAEKKEPKIIPFYKKKITWLVAATVSLLIGLSVCNKYAAQDQQDISNQLIDSVAQIDNVNPATPIQNNNNPIPNYNLANENDILVSSLFVEDKEVDEYITNYILEDI